MINQFVNPVNHPFRSGPLPNSQQRGRGRRFLFARGRRVSNFSRSQFLQQKVEILSPQDYPHIHPVIKRLLYVQNLQSFYPTSGLQYFLKNWEKLTNDLFILELVKSYQIPFLSEPSQTAPTSSISMSQEGPATVD